jgi:tRNA 2-thiouridine synthesizing protein A
MATIMLDALGLKCPQPILKIAAQCADMKSGDLLEVVADCPTFEKDVRSWCERLKKTLLWVKEDEDGKKHCQIQF